MNYASKGVSFEDHMNDPMGGLSAGEPSAMFGGGNPSSGEATMKGQRLPSNSSTPVPADPTTSRSAAPAAPVKYESENLGNIRDFNHMGVDTHQSRDKTNATVGNAEDFSNHLPSVDNMFDKSGNLTPDVQAEADKASRFTENQNKMNAGSKDIQTSPADYSKPIPMVPGINEQRQMEKTKVK